MKSSTTDIISPEQAKTLSGLFRERVRRSPKATAFRYCDNVSQQWHEVSWAKMNDEVQHWRSAIAQENLAAGDRVAIMLHNSCQWVLFEQAALAEGLVVVPLYVNDRAENIAYILQDTSARLLLIEGAEHWRLLAPVIGKMAHLARVITLDRIAESSGPLQCCVDEWLDVDRVETDSRVDDPDALATIVYTSGTTGHPKGVMLSHRNILWNAYSGQQSIQVYTEDLFLSFLPLSHTLERSIGYYLPMMAGSTIAYSRSIPLLAEDLLTVRPTILISVPRIFERVYSRINTQLSEKSPAARWLFNLAISVGWSNFLYQQHRSGWRPSLLLWPLLKLLIADKVIDKLGGRLRVAICGGAPLSMPVAKLFIGLGLPLCQGYGLTETSPVISVNRLEDNEPASVGTALQDVEIRVGDDQELLVKSPGVMSGYWNNPQATAEIIDEDGWLHTGDKVRVEDRHIYITGRLKEIIVLSNGEKLPPADMEMAIASDHLFEQVMIAGEGKPFLIAIVVLSYPHWVKLAAKLGVAEDAGVLNGPPIGEALKARIAKQLHMFPGYARVHGVIATLEPWTVENGLLTPTLKLRRKRILAHFEREVDKVYAGH